MLKRLIAAMALLGFAGALAGCNTVAGLGRDVEKLGDKIEKKAEEKKKY